VSADEGSTWLATAPLTRYGQFIEMVYRAVVDVAGSK
jgi:hypothetical protein